ncbi:MAG: copper amine oxidase N-terminal domain-containing protein [Firmicutes bacterium]|nr:copper amine oxidase N-terminal domain-containing protein [Bacillota bacterium]
MRSTIRTSKIFVISILIITLLAMGSVTAFGEQTASTDITVVLNGQTLNFDQPALGIDNRTMVPVRGILEALGATVGWDQETLTITASLGEKNIEMYVGRNTAYVNGEKVMLDVPPLVINGRTLVPVRFVSESLNATVLWDDPSRTVSIYTAGFDMSVIPAAETPAEPVTPIVETPAPAVQTDPNAIQWGPGFYTSQQGISGACYLASLSMLSSNLNGKEIWCSTTYRLNGSKAYVTWDLYGKINIARISRDELSGKSIAEKTNYILALLNAHPEGVIAKFVNSAGRTHFILIRGYANGKFLVNDPACNEVYVPLDQAWTGRKMLPGYEAAMNGLVFVETFKKNSDSFNWSFLN